MEDEIYIEYEGKENHFDNFENDENFDDNSEISDDETEPKVSKKAVSSDDSHYPETEPDVGDSLSSSSSKSINYKSKLRPLKTSTDTSNNNKT